MPVYGNMADKSMALRVGGYRRDSQKLLVRDHDPDQPDQDFKCTHNNSITFEFEREEKECEFHERFD